MTFRHINLVISAFKCPSGDVVRCDLGSRCAVPMIDSSSRRHDSCIVPEFAPSLSSLVNETSICAILCTTFRLVRLSYEFLGRTALGTAIARSRRGG